MDRIVTLSCYHVVEGKGLHEALSKDFETTPSDRWNSLIFANESDAPIFYRAVVCHTTAAGWHANGADSPLAGLANPFYRAPETADNYHLCINRS